MDLFLQGVVEGLVLGSTYALIALGFTLVFGVLGVLNVAQADFYMTGAYASWVTLGCSEVDWQSGSSRPPPREWSPRS